MFIFFQKPKINKKTNKNFCWFFCLNQKSTKKEPKTFVDFLPKPKISKKTNKNVCWFFAKTKNQQKTNILFAKTKNQQKHKQTVLSMFFTKPNISKTTDKICCYVLPTQTNRKTTNNNMILVLCFSPTPKINKNKQIYDQFVWQKINKDTNQQNVCRNTKMCLQNESNKNNISKA